MSDRQRPVLTVCVCMFGCVRVWGFMSVVDMHMALL
jgi:hypothetical protein